MDKNLKSIIQLLTKERITYQLNFTNKENKSKLIVLGTIYYSNIIEELGKYGLYFDEGVLIYDIQEIELLDDTITET